MACVESKLYKILCYTPESVQINVSLSEGAFCDQCVCVSLPIKCSGFLLNQDVIRLSFFSQPDGSLMGNGSYRSSVLVPGYVTE